uniref:NPC1_N domain-containing protein n=1 Tax=Heterorhabditis bacteriophora TaxID=37862 RepID=A0A1I7X8K3_HETBA
MILFLDTRSAKIKLPGGKILNPHSLTASKIIHLLPIYSTRDNFYCFQNLPAIMVHSCVTLGNNYTYGFPCECPKCASHCSSYTENQISRTAMFLAQVKTLLVDKAPLLCSSLGDTSKCSKLTTSKSFYQVQLFDLSLHLLSDIHLKVSDTDLSDESSCKGNDTIVSGTSRYCTGFPLSFLGPLLILLG